MKTCKKCNTDYPATEEYFYKTKAKGKYYLQSRCKSCYNTHNYNQGYINKWMDKGEGVYGIFSGNECLYVGESSRLNARMCEHKTNIKNIVTTNPTSINLYIRIAKHNNVVVKVLEETKNHKEREQYYINKFNPLYNA